jgi:hypothetical protein
MHILPATKRLYAGSMRGARRVLERGGVAAQVPPLEQRWRHWAYSLSLVHDSAAMADLDVPWWTYGAIAQVDDWLRSRPEPARVFEYGSGASTVWLARRAAEVHSVEHDADFARSMEGALVGHPRANVQVVEAVPCAAPATPSAKEGHGGLDFTDYVGAINHVPGSFDLVVIDGRARGACLQAAVGRLAEDGLIVFDNSRRRRYRAAIKSSGLDETALRGLTPTLPYPEQTSLLARP